MMFIPHQTSPKHSPRAVLFYFVVMIFKSIRRGPGTALCAVNRPERASSPLPYAASPASATSGTFFRLTHIPSPQNRISASHTIPKPIK
jgi:hypothetical protein